VGVARDLANEGGGEGVWDGGGGPRGQVGGAGGGGDLLQGGILVGPLGPGVELVGPWLSPDGTGHVAPIGLGGCLHGLPIR